MNVMAIVTEKCMESVVTAIFFLVGQYIIRDKQYFLSEMIDLATDSI